MIDGIKAIIKDNLEVIRDSLDFKEQLEVDIKTGAIDDVQRNPIAKYKSLIFEDKGSVIEVRGSIHKLYNQGRHNYNRFGLSEIHLAVYELADKLKLLVSDVRLTNIEFGVNLIIDFEPRLFLNSLIYHKGKKFTYRERVNMQYSECSHGQYYIKVYDKGLQFGLNKHVLRVELKFIKMERINNLGIKYLSDLLDPKKLERLREELLRVYDEILIAEPNIKPTGLPIKDEMLIAHGKNDKYWDSILPISAHYPMGNADKEYKREKRDFHRKMNRFKNLLRKIGADDKQLLVRKLIEAESAKLIGEANTRNQKVFEKCHQLTDHEGRSSDRKLSPIDREYKKERANTKKENLSLNDRLLYSDKKGQHVEPRTRKCLVTGLNISMQKEDSKFICTTGLEYYKKNNPEVWQKLWQRLTPRCRDLAEDKQIEEIHHSIRNEYFNKIHSTKRSIEKLLKQPALFDQMQFIRKDKLKMAGFSNLNNRK